jgi:predicted nucleotidyltransferase
MRIKDLLFEQADLVTVNRRLNPKLWDKDMLKPEIKKQLVKIAEVFQEFIGVDLDVIDFTLTGSNANYTWTEYSDLDLHIIVKGMPDEKERELYNAKKALWAEEHNITIKSLPVECYVQGEKEEHHSTGVYSILADQWLEKPKKVKPKIDDASVKAKKNSIHHDIETALLSKDITKLRAVKLKITQMRKAGLEKAGEWSTENLVFKILRNLGMIDKLTQEIRDLEDQELSLETSAVPQL